MTVQRTVAQIDSEIESLRVAKASLASEPIGGDRVRQRHILDERERQLLLDREAAAEDEQVARSADLEAKIEAAEARIDEARHAEAAAIERFTETDHARNAAAARWQAATQELEQRKMRYESLLRELHSVSRAQSATPAGMRSAAEAALATIVFGTRENSICKFGEFEIAGPSVAAVAAIEWYLRSNAPDEEKREFRARFNAAGRQAFQDQQRGVHAHLSDRSDENEKRSIAQRSAQMERIHASEDARGYGSPRAVAGKMAKAINPAVHARDREDSGDDA